MTSIRNIIFDYGGVILNIDHEKPVEAFHRLGLKDFGEMYSHAMQLELFDQLEKGTLSRGDFLEAIRRISGLYLGDADIVRAWNSILGDMPAHRIRLLERLRTKYRIFLLSNTNEIHYAEYARMLREQYGYADFDALFGKAYFSFRLGMKKPDEEIFRFVMQDSGLDPAGTLFIDDSLRHVKGAAGSGLQCIWLQEGKDVSSVFDPESMEVRTELLFRL